MMRTGALFAVCLGLVACGDSVVKDTPPELVAQRIVVTLPEDGSATVDATAVDAQTTTLTYTATTPAHGDLTGTGPTFTYVPAKNYNGPDTLTLTISDGRNALMVPVDITVLPVDDAPVASDVQASTNENQGVAVKLVASDIDSAELTYSIVTQPAHGTVAGVPPNLSYTPTSHYFGSDSFSYQASDGVLASAVAVVTIAIANVITCGDGVVEGSEQCDDGNNVDTDGCLNNCMTARCGDGVAQAEVEQCDDGNADNTDACLDTCAAARCGDGFLHAGVEQCDDGNTINTDGCTNACQVAVCGDGIIEGDEQCDDGNLSNTDGCLNTCVTASCGDGFVQAEVEQCDDGNADNADGCLNSCVIATCGDGFVELGVEQCDDGNNSNNDACLNTCVTASCGDGFVFTGFEQCDDGNSSNNDACLNTCVNAFCGDGFVEVGVEQCDDANASNNDACLNTCVAASCGDGFVFAGFEQCDDGNNSNNDACLNTCVNAFCGDGFVEAGVEQCDDANASNADACLNTCVAASCGDGFVRVGVEQCDDANANNNDACLNTCVAASCGDGFVEAGVEQCDDANANNNDACLDTCVAASCGDGFVEAGVEQCDDGNVSNADACLATCVAATCGDGFVEAGVEQCDDGNQVDNDGCHNDCTLPACGNGVLEPGEECDDGNTADDDGCGHSCKIERCGDGLVQFSRGEQCDDGNTVGGDGCDASCLAEPYTNTTPVLISDTLSCTTAVANASHRVAVDSDGRIYAVYQCGTSGFVSISTDRGLTFSAPFDLTATGATELQISQIAIGTGEVGTAYAALQLTTGEVVLRTTTDFGATWGATVSIGTASSTSSGLGLQSFNDDVYVGFSTSGGVSLAHSLDQARTFTTVPVAMTIAFFDLSYDVRQRTVVVSADTPSLHLRISTDRGATFATEVVAPGQEFYSDWSMGNGEIFVSGINIGGLGNSTRLYVIPTSAPTTSTAISGLTLVHTAQSRSVMADANGNAYVSSQRDGGGVQLDRLPFGSTSLEVSRTLSNTATSPNAGPLPGGLGVVVIYTEGSQVWATVQAYPASLAGGAPGG